MKKEKLPIFWRAAKWIDNYKMVGICTTDGMDYVVKVEDNCMKLIGNRVVYEANAYKNIYVDENYLILIPASSEKIVRIRLDDESEEYIDVPFRENWIGKSQWKFSGCIKHADYYYFFPINFSGILCVNWEKRSIVIIDEWVKDIPEKDICDGLFPMNEPIIENGYLLIPFRNVDAVFQLNFETNTGKVLVLKGGSKGYISIGKNENDYWLLSNDTDNPSIIKWNYSTGETEKYDLSLDKYLMKKNAFINAVVLNANMYILACHASKNLIVDLDTKDVTVFELGNMDDFGFKKNAGVHVEDGEMYLSSSEGWIQWNPIDNIVKIHDIDIDKSIYELIAERKALSIKSCKDILIENELIGLNHLILSIQ